MVFNFKWIGSQVCGGGGKNETMNLLFYFAPLHFPSNLSEHQWMTSQQQSTKKRVKQVNTTTVQSTIQESNIHQQPKPYSTILAQLKHHEYKGSTHKKYKKINTNSMTFSDCQIFYFSHSTF